MTPYIVLAILILLTTSNKERKGVIWVRLGLHELGVAAKKGYKDWVS